MALPAKRLPTAPRRAITEAQLLRLVGFPAVRRAISGGLDRARPEKVHIPAQGAFIRFRLEDPARYHPALFSTLRRGHRGTLIVIGTPRAHVKKPAALAAFLARMGWDPRSKRWGRRLSADERRSLIYQLRAAGITGGSRAQAVLVPRARVEAVAARFISRPAALRKVGGNPILATLGIGNPGRYRAMGAGAVVTEEERRALVGTRVTLDGEPATISGVKLPFARISSLASSRSGEWSWSAAKDIVHRGGAFRSNPRRGRSKRRAKCPPGRVRARSGKCVRRARQNLDLEAAYSRHLASRNPAGAIRVPFRSGQKVTTAALMRWVASLPAGPFKRRYVQAIGQYKRFHLGKLPSHWTFKTVPMGSQAGITDIDFVVSEGKEWAATYQVPRHSGKYEGDGSDGRYVHAHGESKMEVDIRRPARKSQLPERFHTADGKFVGVIPTRNVKITDWYRG